MRMAERHLIDTNMIMNLLWRGALVGATAALPFVTPLPVVVAK